MMPDSLPPFIDLASKVTPFGVRFWDVLTQSAIQGGVSVTAFSPDKPEVRLPAFPNRVGVYVIQGVPKLGGFEMGSGDADFWRAAPAGKTYIVEVIDLEDRFLPCVFEATIPARGLFQWPCAIPGSPIESPPVSAIGAVPLFSTPHRSILGGMAVVRAVLVNPATKQPVAWARLTVSIGSTMLAEAISGQDGSVTACFPYPERRDSSEAPLAEWSWTIDISVERSALALPWKFPDLCDLLNQDPVHVWSVYDSAGPQVALGEQTLTYGQELILRSRMPDGRPLSELYIT